MKRAKILNPQIVLATREFLFIMPDDRSGCAKMRAGACEMQVVTHAEAIHREENGAHWLAVLRWFHRAKVGESFNVPGPNPVSYVCVR